MTTFETVDDARQRRQAHAGAVDFTMMYIAHDAFTRDLARLVHAAGTDTLLTAEGRGTWAMFSRQLITHHDAEDEALWPSVRAGASNHDRDLLDAMESEHAALDPLVEAIDDALFRGETSLGEDLATLAELLTTHMRHEEDEALPMVERVVGADGWAEFGKHVRSAQGGVKGARSYLTWVLDEAPPWANDAMMRMLPGPVRVLYRRSWEPSYRRTPHLTGAGTPAR